MDLSRWIARNAAWRPHWPALVFEDEPVSFRALDEGIGQLAGALAGTFAIKRGDRIAILAYNRPEYVALVFAAARLGAIVVPLNWRLAPPEHGHILADADPALIIVDGDLAGRADDLARLAPRAHRGSIEFSAEGWTDLADACEVAARPPEPAGRPEDPVLLVYTSGTTGRPKGAVITQSAVTWNAVNSVWAHDFTSEDRVLTTLPLFHVGGLNIQTLPALHAGATVVLHPRFEPARVIDAIERDGVTLTVLVPAQLELLAADPRWRSADVSGLRSISTGSTIIGEAFVRKDLHRGVPLLQVYGATETCPIAAYQRREDAPAHPGSIGKPALHCELRLVDEQGRDVAPGESGEIWVRGANVMDGYWDKPRETAAALAGGWYRTGDVAHADADGWLYVDGRRRDVIISGGENVYPAEIENVLAACPGVAEVAVVGRPDERWGEAVVAVVVPARGAALTRDGLCAFLDGRVARYKHPRDVVIADALPRTALGKVKREELKRLARRESVAGPA